MIVLSDFKHWYKEPTPHIQEEPRPTTLLLEGHTKPPRPVTSLWLSVLFEFQEVNGVTTPSHNKTPERGSLKDNGSCGLMCGH